MRKIINRFFLSYIVVLLIPLISLSMYNYLEINSALTKQVEQSHETIIKELSNYVDEQLKELNNIAIQYSCMPWVKEIMFMQGDKFDYSRINAVELNNYVLELKGYDIINNFINSISIVFPQQQFVISSIGVLDMDTFFNSIYKLKNYDNQTWNNILNYYGNFEILGPNKFEYDNNSNVITYIQPIPSIDQKGHAYLIAYINYDELMSKLDDFQISKESSIFILNNKDEFIVNIGNNALTKNIKQIIKNNSNIAKIDSKKFFVFHKVSSLNKWNYIITLPYDLVMKQINYMKKTIIIFLILIIFVGVILSYWLTIRNYDPIMDLINLLKGRFSYKKITIGDEYEFLKKSINILLNEEDFYRQQTEQNKIFVRNAYFIQLLNGSLNEDIVSDKFLKTIDVEFKLKYLLTVIFIYNNVNGISKEYQEICKNIAKNYNNIIYFVELNGTQKIMIVNTDYLDNIEEFILKIKEITENKLRVECIVGVGNAYTNVKELINSFEEAKKSIGYRIASRENTVVFFKELNLINNIYYYPIEKELEILNALRRTNFDEAVNTIQEIISVNINKEGFNVINSEYLLYDMMATLLKAISDLKLEKIIRIDRKNIRNINSLKEIQEYICDLCKEICEKASENKENTFDILKMNILNYINENYSNPNLSLESISEYVGKSVPYISKFFKEQIGLNFLDYLNQKRISKAKQLLNGQMTIAEIANVVGYNSDITFRRVFKKYEKMTPSEYIINMNRYKDA
ncbi:MAG: AraC family transcriptional regulator [Caloramator sp.]|nr:AraC family transcriptional regulator [Caloramator sp.]